MLVPVLVLPVFVFPVVSACVGKTISNAVRIKNIQSNFLWIN